MQPAFPQAPRLSPTEPAPEQPRWLGPYAPLIGGGVGTLLYAITFGLSVALAGGVNSDGYWVIGYFVFAVGLSVVLFTAGIVLVAIQRTRAFGAGLLISIAIGAIVGGGVCVAVLTAA